VVEKDVAFGRSLEIWQLYVSDQRLAPLSKPRKLSRGRWSEGAAEGCRRAQQTTTSVRFSLNSGGSLKSTGSCRKYVVRVASDQSDRPNDQHQNDGQHYRILGDVLAFVVPPHLAQKMSHVRTFLHTAQFYAYED